MSDKRAGGIVASSFVAGLLLTAGIFAPQAWEPVPEPFFGLEEPGAADPSTPIIVGGRRDDGPADAPRPPAFGARPTTEPMLPGGSLPEERLAFDDRPSAAAVGAAVQATAIAAREAVAAAPVAVPAPLEPVSSRPEPAPESTPPLVSMPLMVDAAAPPAITVMPPAPVAPPDSLRALVTRVQAVRPASPQTDLPRPITALPVVAPPPHEETAAAALGAAPLPGDEWVDPDSVNWSDVPLVHPAMKPTVPVPRLGLRPRFRVGERLLGRDRDPDATSQPDVRSSLPDIASWPVPQKLLEQLEALAADSEAAAPAAWATEALGHVDRVLATGGPRDAGANATLVTLGEAVHTGMGVADATTDHSRASATRRAALAVARRVALWRAATGLCAATGPGDPRSEAEVARLLDAVERFEVSTAPEDAAVAARSARMLANGSDPPAAGLAKAVREHYLSANVRVAVHQRFLEKLLPAPTETTGPIDDVVLGRKVRGTRTVQRTTTVRFVPDSDEIAIDLEVHGDVKSRTVTDSGPVSVTSHGDSSFTVRKPIKVSSAGLLFGSATGVASNRSQLANVQTSFDSVPIMRSLVRNIARNQHEENLPELNREVIDTIVSKACREVDEQAEPRFTEIATRIRDRVWTPLMRLGLDPTPVGLETTATTATLRLRLAADEQLAAHTPRPRAPGDAMMSLQVHESTVNNALERLGLAGRSLALEDLLAMLYERAGVEPRIPDDLPEGVRVTFARRQPLRVECRDGLVHMRVSLDAIESGRRNWYDIVAKVSYTFATSGRQVFLERDGPVQLSGPGHQGRIEFALRTIFSKIFPKERPIQVLPDRIVDNPQLEGLQVLQTASTDGWLALALGLREHQTTATQPPAADAQTADPRIRIFR